MSNQQKGNLSVHTENIFPIIKKFLYSDHEIFLRELVSNAVDATQKLKTLATKGEYNQELGNLDIEISIDPEAKTLTIQDRGIGMSQEEVEKYINQIAFSGAEEFVSKYSDSVENNPIIGHFGLGFYSSFMVSQKVEFFTQSMDDSKESIHWECEGSTDYVLSPTEKRERGTTIILHLAEDSMEFLEDSKIESILKKYCSFMPVPIKFKEEYINKSEPLWLKKTSDITDEQYLEFYEKLYPYSEKPLFHIHLNIDYPFNLTGILYFPKWNDVYELQKNKIQLYSNNVFITDEVKDIVPEYLTLLQGVIDSPDIPLNVSRSYLQSDGNVKKISSYIVKKVTEKLNEIFKADRQQFEDKWKDIGFFSKYGSLSDDKFWEKAKDFTLVTNVEGKNFTLPEYEEHVQAAQKDKDGRLVYIYSNQPVVQDIMISSMKSKGYDVLEFSQPIDNHFIQMLESKLENVSFKRVDSESAESMIDTGVKLDSLLSKEQEEKLVEVFSQFKVEGPTQYNFQVKALGTNEQPVILIQNEFMRRMSEMSKMSGNSMGMGSFPVGYDVIINASHPLAKEISDSKDETSNTRISQHLFDVARLAQNQLIGKDLTKFIERSLSFIK